MSAVAYRANVPSVASAPYAHGPFGFFAGENSAAASNTAPLHLPNAPAAKIEPISAGDSARLYRPISSIRPSQAALGATTLRPMTIGSVTASTFPDTARLARSIPLTKILIVEPSNVPATWDHVPMAMTLAGVC